MGLKDNISIYSGQSSAQSSAQSGAHIAIKTADIDDNVWLGRLMQLTLLVSFVFMIVPQTDIRFSGLFADVVGTFPLHENRILLALRDLHRTLPAIIVPALLMGIIIQAVFNRRWLPAPHKLLYILAVYAIGALLVVHSLKYLVGRARPSEILDFGGSLLFSPAWQVSQACMNNCSFPSGEGASAMAMLSIPLILGGIYRLRLMVLAGIVALIFSLNRIVMGAHFLSDVMLSWLFVALTMAWLWPVFQRNSTVIDAYVAQSGNRIHSYFKRASFMKRDL